MRDAIRPCPVCQDTTAHQWRAVPWPTLAGLALAAPSALFAILAFPYGTPAALPFALLGIWVVARDRQERWDIACGRCRARVRAQGRWGATRTTHIIDF